MKTYKHTGPTRNQHCHWGSGEPTVRLEGSCPPAARALDRPLPDSAPGPTWLRPQDITECAACTLERSPRTQRSLLKASNTAAKSWV